MEHDAHAGHEHMDHDHMNHDHMDHGGHQNHTGHDDHGGHKDHTGQTGHAGHGGHAGHVAQFRRLFWIMLVIAVPVVAFNDMFAELIGYELPDTEVIGWISPALGTVMYLWGGRPFLTGAWSELRARKPGMMLLIALAITVAFLASWAATLGLVHHEL